MAAPSVLTVFLPGLIDAVRNPELNSSTSDPWSLFAYHTLEVHGPFLTHITDGVGPNTSRKSLLFPAFDIDPASAHPDTPLLRFWRLKDGGQPPKTIDIPVTSSLFSGDELLAGFLNLSNPPSRLSFCRGTGNLSAVLTIAFTTLSAFQPVAELLEWQWKDFDLEHCPAASKNKKRNGVNCGTRNLTSTVHYRQVISFEQKKHKDVAWICPSVSGAGRESTSAWRLVKQGGAASLRLSQTIINCVRIGQGKVEIWTLATLRAKKIRQSLRQSAAVKFAAHVQPVSIAGIKPRYCTSGFESAGDDLNIASAAVCGSPAANKQLQISCSGSLRQLQRHFWHFAAAVLLFAAAVLRQSAAVLRLSAAV
ncbi:hypothetical protein B0H11DRAFT_1914747 [Mycena galericulata]|nr:hypothetical protein B0H11DRAFT_1914747 [Mycena galericulata]